MNPTPAFFNYWNSRRVYFYLVDFKGNVFLDHQSKRPLRTREFLDFFYRRLRPRDDAKLAEACRGCPPEYRFDAELYPYYSPCGKEINLVRSPFRETSPLVFHDLNLEARTLTYGATLESRYVPELVKTLSVDEKHQFLTHPLITLNDDRDAKPSRALFGMLHPQLVTRLVSLLQ